MTLSHGEVKSISPPFEHGINLGKFWQIAYSGSNTKRWYSFCLILLRNLSSEPWSELGRSLRLPYFPWRHHCWCFDWWPKLGNQPTDSINGHLSKWRCLQILLAPYCRVTPSQWVTPSFGSFQLKSWSRNKLFSLGPTQIPDSRSLEHSNIAVLQYQVVVQNMWHGQKSCKVLRAKQGL